MTVSSTSWKPGESGNPSGRPAILRSVIDAARAHTEEAIGTLHSLMTDANQPGSVRVAAAEALLSRGWGKSPAWQQVSIITEPPKKTVDKMTEEELMAIIAAKA